MRLEDRILNLSPVDLEDLSKERLTSGRENDAAKRAKAVYCEARQASISSSGAMGAQPGVDRP